MKNILLIGKNSYLAKSARKLLMIHYNVDTLSVRDQEWKTIDFSKYDSCICFIGIAHKNVENSQDYYSINRDLVYDIANEAKKKRLSQFIFISSMSVYGLDSGEIKKNTKEEPKTHYGKSKLEAEQLLIKLDSKEFKVAIIRPPMIYGKNCKGNYPKLSKLIQKSPIFPKTDNKRSMIYVDNFSEFLKCIIKYKEKGIFHPQNEEYVNTSNLAKNIAIQYNHRLYISKIIYIFINLIKTSTIKKMFGSLYYEKSLSLYNFNYNIVDFEESVRKTER